MRAFRSRTTYRTDVSRAVPDVIFKSHAYMDTIIDIIYDTIISSLRAAVDALVQSQDGRTCVYQMEALELATELAYRELLIKEHVDGLSQVKKSPKN